MSSDRDTTPRRSPPERGQTDDNLRTERQESDRKMLERQAAVESNADDVIQRARTAADVLLLAARDRADRRLHVADAGATRSTVAAERVLEDEALRGERASADEVLRDERAESARVLSRLLPLERDRTDRSLLVERVRSDADLASRDDFLSIVSHDLRNLLGGIVLSAEVWGETPAASDSGTIAREGAARILRYAARMNRLIGDLVDIVSIDAGRLAVTPTRGDVSALLAEAVKLFERAAAAKGLSLQTDRTAPALLASFDHDRLIQILANLITNSIKFTPPGGSIHLGAERTGDHVTVSITDTGCGIDETMLDAVFQRFWQGGEDDRRGVGLGLYIVRCLVEAHGGTITARSTPGRGSTFSFTLERHGE